MSEERKWTPGPWRAEHRETPRREGYFTEVFTEDGGSGKGCIATLDWYPKAADRKGSIGTYREANAHLIAAAPDLYEALSNFANGDRGVSYVDALEIARAALCKARGEA